MVEALEPYATYLRKGFQVVFKEVYHFYLHIVTNGRFRPLSMAKNLRINAMTGEIIHLFSWSEIVSPLRLWLLILFVLALTTLPLLDPRRPGQFIGTVTVHMVISMAVLGWLLVNEELVGQLLEGVGRDAADDFSANIVPPVAPPIAEPPVHAEL